MIGIMIDHKLLKLKQSLYYTFNYVFDTLGVPYKYVENLNDSTEQDITFVYSLLEPTGEEIRNNFQNGVVVYIQAEPELLTLSKLSKEFIEANTKDLKLFNTFPVICSRNFENPVEIRKSHNFYWGKFNFDVFANIFFHLSGYDEQINTQFDEHGRYTDSNLSFLSYVRVPYVNYLLWMLENFIKEIVQGNPSLSLVRIDYWPSGEDFAYAVSHNIDRLQKWDTLRFLKSFFSDIYLLVGFKFPMLFQNIKEKTKYLLTNCECYWRFEDIQHILSNYSTRSTWFVGALDDGDENGEIDYLFDDPDLQEELRNIITNKGEIGLLTDVNSEKNKGVENQKKRLSTGITGRVKGVRNVIGKYLNDSTPNCYDSLDFLYDSSKSLTDQVGFRNGIAFPYKPYISANEKETKHWEIPLIFSDHFLQLTKYKIVSRDTAKDIVKTLVKSIQETNGLLTFNFSISRFNDINYLPKLMEYTLRLVSDRRSFSGTLSELLEWWEKRKQITIKENPESVSLTSAENIKQLTLTIWGVKKIKKVTGARSDIKGNVITLKDIHKDAEVVIHLPQDDQMYLKMEEETDTKA